MKKIYYPYYSEFKCIGGECPLSCCCFRINIFRFEEKKFGTFPQWCDIDGRGTDIREFLNKDETGYYMKSLPDGCCIFRDCDKMCSIQKRYGMDALPAICRTYPRIISRFKDRIEFALEPCCPMAARSAEHWDIRSVISDDVREDENPSWFRRDKALSILADAGIGFSDCLRQLSDLYGCGREIPETDLTPFLYDFLRKQTALMIWGYILYYDGIKEVGNIMEFIIDIVLAFIKQASHRSYSRWGDACDDYSRFLLEYSTKRNFIQDYEDRFNDRSDYQ